MRKTCLALAMVFAAGVVGAQELNVDWAYHDDADHSDDRATEMVPGEEFTFVGNGTLEVASSEPVTLYVLTANNFAGDADEQIFVRWWNGQQESWIQGEWVKNIHLGDGEKSVGTFHNQPVGWEEMIDLWKFTIGPEITQPGDNYYVIQLKGWKDGQAVEYYLLRDSVGDDARENNIGQAWTAAPDYADRDWKITIAP